MLKPASRAFLIGPPCLAPPAQQTSNCFFNQNFVVSFRKFNGLGMPDLDFLID